MHAYYIIQTQFILCFICSGYNRFLMIILTIHEHVITVPLTPGKSRSSFTANNEIDNNYVVLQETKNFYDAFLCSFMIPLLR